MILTLILIVLVIVFFEPLLEALGMLVWWIGMLCSIVVPFVIALAVVLWLILAFMGKI